MNGDSFTTRRRWLGDYFYVGFISAFDTGHRAAQVKTACLVTWQRERRCPANAERDTQFCLILLYASAVTSRFLTRFIVCYLVSVLLCLRLKLSTAHPFFPLQSWNNSFLNWVQLIRYNLQKKLASNVACTVIVNCCSGFWIQVRGPVCLSCCIFKRMQIRDGRRGTDRVIGRYCGTDESGLQPRTTQSTGVVIFHSDGTRSGKGFLIPFHAKQGRPQFRVILTVQTLTFNGNALWTENTRSWYFTVGLLLFCNRLCFLVSLVFLCADKMLS